MVSLPCCTAPPRIPGRPSSSTCSGASLARGTSTGTAPIVTGARPPWPVSCTSGGFSAAARSRTCGRCRPAALLRHHAALLRPGDRGLAVDLDRPVQRPRPPLHRPPAGRWHRAGRARRRPAGTLGLPGHLGELLPLDRRGVRGRPPHVAPRRADVHPPPGPWLTPGRVTCCAG